MDQSGIIRDLLFWLEAHLDSPLSIDNVAARAGYSKWHLQRMFKEVTGQSVGSYIRGRRLSKSAVALRLTARPILDIALQYRFDSQQTFTRAFKKQFGLTPAYYRRSPEWSAVGICSPIHMDDFILPEVTYVTLPEIPLIGVTRSYSCTLEELSDFRHEMRTQFWLRFLGQSPLLPKVLYGLHEPRPGSERDDEQEVFYTTALKPADITTSLSDSHAVHIEGGEYARFDYSGPTTGLQDFILTVYGTCMPSLKLTRRQGQDIECFYPQSDRRTEGAPMQIRCEYMIPIRR